MLVEDNKVSFKSLRGEGNSELEEIKFEISDGENVEEIIKDAKELLESGKMDFSITPRKLKKIKTIRIIPIIKINGKI